jgi:gliding motility-associated lipoprotein GldD
MNKSILFIALLATGLFSCRENPVPKPVGYYRIDFQKKSYHSLPSGFPYTFDIPDYSFPVPDNSARTEPWWINIEVPVHKAEIHISYKKINNNLPVFTEESRKLAYDHTLKASSIEEYIYLNPARKVFGTIYHINGNAASPMQFYLTDSTRHFLRGALYIRATPNIDSLKPVIDFLKSDVMRIIQTLTWND